MQKCIGSIGKAYLEFVMYVAHTQNIELGWMWGKSAGLWLVILSLCVISLESKRSQCLYMWVQKKKKKLSKVFFFFLHAKVFCMLANCMNTSLHALTWESTQYICETYCCYLCMYVTKVMYVFAYCSDDFVSRQINSVTTSCWTVLICYIKETIEVLSLAYI